MGQETLDGFLLAIKRSLLDDYDDQRGSTDVREANGRKNEAKKPPKDDMRPTCLGGTMDENTSNVILTDLEALNHNIYNMCRGMDNMIARLNYRNSKLQAPLSGHAPNKLQSNQANSCTLVNMKDHCEASSQLSVSDGLSLDEPNVSLIHDDDVQLESMDTLVDHNDDQIDSYSKIDLCSLSVKALIMSDSTLFYGNFVDQLVCEPSPPLEDVYDVVNEPQVSDGIENIGVEEVSVITSEKMESSGELVPFPLLMTPIESNYRTCTIPYRFPSDNPKKPTPTELSWIYLFMNSIPSFRKRAESDDTVPDAPLRAEKFAQRKSNFVCRGMMGLPSASDPDPPATLVLPFQPTGLAFVPVDVEFGLP
ncbi:hypothetical protein FXO38_16428 [Capsicum annuum]|nr:hypothetical protein FXO38_16428 [Capsicum annuum]KAF3673917.1 hypothetical protein FXO37_06698 [Capsicum annuum]